MKYLLLLHGNNGHAIALHCYFIRTLPVLFTATEIFLRGCQQHDFSRKGCIWLWTDKFSVDHWSTVVLVYTTGMTLLKIPVSFSDIIRSFKYFHTTANVILQIRLLGIYTGRIIYKQVRQLKEPDCNHTAPVRAGSCTKRICLRRCCSPYLLTSLLTYFLT